MQKVRGFVFFTEKEKDEVQNTHHKVGENLSLNFFENFFRDEEKINHAGVLVSGEIEDGYSSTGFVSYLRRLLGVEGHVDNCDFSVEAEDVLKYIREGERRGNYIGIRILPHYHLEDIYTLASSVGDILGAKDVFVRTVEKNPDLEEPSVCMEFITDSDYNDYHREIGKEIKRYDLQMSKVMLANLE